MKYLILFLITFSAHANYIKKSKVGLCEQVTVHMKKSRCGKNCIKITKNYNCNYSEIKALSIEKYQIQSCLDEADCQAKHELNVCEDGNYSIKNIDLLEVYCTRTIPEHIGKNKDLKDAYDLAKQTLKDEKKAIKDKAKAVKSTKKKWKDLTANQKDHLIDYIMENM